LISTKTKKNPTPSPSIHIPQEIIALSDKALQAYHEGDLEKASTYFSAALYLNPQHIQTLYNAATTQRRLCNMDTAINLYNTLIALDPQHEHAEFGLAQAHLASGHIEKGWQLFNTWRKPEKLMRCPTHEKELNGKKVIIGAEWGIGDMINFVRYAQNLKKNNAYVIAQVHEPLIHILKSCPWIDHVISIKEKLPAADYYIPLLYLPTFFKTNESSIPASIPYLQADPALISHWQNILANNKNFKIGICWDIGHHDTQFMSWQRSAQLKHWLPLAALPSVSLYSLQKDGLAQCTAHAEAITIHDFGPEFDQAHGSFMDSAAIMKCMDLIITVDTSIAHLAGALGVPTWMMLPSAPDYRWTLQGDSTPWYPTMRLFRQKNAGDWDCVMQEIVHELCKILDIKPKEPELKTRNKITTHEINSMDLLNKLYSKKRNFIS
jgi:tetratricopeptide (TPR) repeat protein